jgi:hypothetical protein
MVAVSEHVSSLTGFLVVVKSLDRADYEDDDLISNDTHIYTG